MKPVIKFSHIYEKMPDDLSDPTMLLAVFSADTKEFGELFIKHDTLYWNNGKRDPKAGIGFYELPKGKVLVLLLITGHKGHLWTTVRRWTPEKERYYRGIIGQGVQIEISV